MAAHAALDGLKPPRRRPPPPVSLPDGAQRWILEQFEQVTRLQARQLIPVLDIRYPTGIVPPRSKRRRAPRITNFDLFVKQKLAHPCHIILVRIGNSYEAVGVDAVLVVQHAEVNPVASRRRAPPRALVSPPNLHRVLELLVQERGFSVVMVEERESQTRYGQRTARKERYVAGVVTPAEPFYCFNQLEGALGGADVVKPPPVVGVADTSRGSMLLSLDQDSHVLSITRDLSFEALASCVNATRAATPVLLHTRHQGPRPRSKRQAGSDAVWEIQMREWLGPYTGVSTYMSDDPISGFEDAARKLLSLPPDAPIMRHEGSRWSPETPRPPYLSTARHLGLYQVQGVPDLVGSLVAPGTSAAVRDFLRHLLLLPPPAPVVGTLHAACDLLLTPTAWRSGLPIYVTTVSATKVRLLLTKGEANDNNFRDLMAVLAPVLDTLRSDDPAHISFSKLLMPVVCREANLGISAEQLADGCTCVLSEVAATVPMPSFFGAALPAWFELGGHSSKAARCVLPRSTQELHAAAVQAVLPSPRSGASGAGVSSSLRASTVVGSRSLREAPTSNPAQGRTVALGYGSSLQVNKASSVWGGPEVLQQLEKRMNKGFRGRVHAELMQSEVDQVDVAARQVRDVLRKVYSDLDSIAMRLREKPPRCLVDKDNVAVWLLPSKKAVGLAKEELGLHHPIDRNGRTLVNRYSTPALDEALQRYRLATNAARAAARARLRALSARLVERHMAPLLAACHFSVIASALVEHVEWAGCRRLWVLPEVVAAGGEFSVQGAWPYWMDGTLPTTIRNSFELNGMVILTGPNMAGKSTLLRMVASIALLAHAGLLVPAEAAVVPRLEAFLLRMFSGDSPTENLSSFQVEMDEMRCALQDASPNSLVLVDEFGKGTDVRVGTALAGALLEQLGAAGVRGVFATHLHMLNMLPLRMTGVTRMRMEVAPLEEGGGGAYAEAGGSSDASGCAGVSRPVNPALVDLPVAVSPDIPGLKLLRPTWRMLPGSCTESLALEVALKQIRCRPVGTFVVSAAARYLQQLPTYEQLAAGVEAHKQRVAEARAQQLRQRRRAPAATTREHPGTAAIVAAPVSSSTRPATSRGRGGSDSTGSPTVALAPTASQRPPPLTIHDARTVLVRVLSYMQRQHLLPPLPQPPEAAVVIRRGQAPVTGHARKPCVYVLRWRDGWFYCGQSMGMATRSSDHKKRRGGIDLDYVYLPMGTVNAALAAESALIQELERLGFPMWSTHDARRL